MTAKYTHIKPKPSYDDATYEAIEDYSQEQYGTFRNQFQTGSTPRGARRHHNTQLVQSSDVNTSTEGGYLDGSNGKWRSDTLALRDKPVILSDKTKTSIRHVWGNYTLAVVMLFAITFPCGLILLTLLPFLCTKKTKWMKDTEHVDPISNNLIGVYRRGKQDAPQTISFYRLANKDDSDEDELEDEESFDSSQNPGRRNNNHRRSSGRRSLHRSTSQSNSYSGRHRPNQGSTARVRFSENLVSTDPIKLFITFKGKPVQLPDGETTITRKRIGSCNLICAYVTYFLGFIVFPIPLLCFLMPCLKDTEHVHPRTKEIVGVNYKDSGILI